MPSLLPAISLSGVTKSFPRNKTARELLALMLNRPSPDSSNTFTALHPLTLQIPKGQTWGIVGRNGSGKSTLLQLIAGTLQPTAGSIRVEGRVAALLELGSGFHPDFTGRENVFFQGLIQGCDRDFIQQKYADIAAFADIGDFVDQPVKTYSSGMLVRLAFAVTIALDPDLLIIDEALAVGDEAFQRKCFARIRALHEKGCTVLFVSHAGGQIIELCDHAILLDAGEKLLEGAPKQVISQYHRLLFSPSELHAQLREQIRHGQIVAHSSSPQTPDPQIVLQASNLPSPPPTPEILPDEAYDPSAKPQSTLYYPPLGAQIQNPRIERLNRTPVTTLSRGQYYLYTFDVAFDQPAHLVRFGMLIKTIGGFELGGAVSHTLSNRIDFVPAGKTLRVDFRFTCNLQPGVYFLNSGVLADNGNGETYLHRIIDAAMFRVPSTPGLLATAVIDFNIQPTISVSSIPLPEALLQQKAAI